MKATAIAIEWEVSDAPELLELYPHMLKQFIAYHEANGSLERLETFIQHAEDPGHARLRFATAFIHYLNQIKWMPSEEGLEIVTEEEAMGLDTLRQHLDGVAERLALAFADREEEDFKRVLFSAQAGMFAKKEWANALFEALFDVDFVTDSQLFRQGRPTVDHPYRYLLESLNAIDSQDSRQYVLRRAYQLAREKGGHHVRQNAAAAVG